MSKKIGIIVDSSVAYTAEEAKKLGYGFIPILIAVEENGKEVEYKSGVNLQGDKLSKMLNEGVKMKTAAPKPAWIMETFEEELKKFDELIVFAITEEMSVTRESMAIIAKEEKFSGKVHVLKSRFLSWNARAAIAAVQAGVKEGQTTSELIKIAESYNKSSSLGYFAPRDMKRLKVSGRVGGASALIGGMLRITPVLKLENGGISKEPVAKIKTQTKAMDRIVQEVLNEKKSPEKFDFAVVHTSDENVAKEMIVKLEAAGVKNKMIIMPLANEIAVHIGTGSVGVAFIAK